MNERNCFVLLQSREESEYNDFIGKFYHFPKKYLKQLSQLDIEFIYYEPKKKGEGVYFGYGRIKRIFEDKRESEHYFAEIVEYKPFSKPVAFLDDGGKQREQGPGFNIQNSVRSISPEVMEEICLDGGIELNFKADAHLVKVLGEQLIASEKVGILELIKNSYDAQASYCLVRIEKVPSLLKVEDSEYRFKELEGPVIIIEDDGIGMTREVIEQGWLRPASTLKTITKEQLRQERQKAIKNGKLGAYESLVTQLKKEHKNRIPLGEKGVGRFATHRLGKKLTIVTKVKELDYEYVLKIDWDLFDQISQEGVDLDSIGISLSRQMPSRDYAEGRSGTQIIIYGGKEGFSWDKLAIEDLNKSILKLNSPNPNPKKIKNTFKASFECPQLPDLEKENILEGIIPVFTFDGLVDRNGVLDYVLRFQPPKSVPMVEDEIKDKSFNLRKGAKDYWAEKNSQKDFREPQCGPFYLHLEIWYRTEPWVDTLKKKDVVEYLTDFGGISIFRDGVNIFPAEWGAEMDWLELQTRHIKQGFRMSYYNMVGNIEIDQTDNLDLVDMTNRQGLINNIAYDDLVKLMQTILWSIIEPQFIDKRDKYNDLTKGVILEPKILKDYTKQGERLVSNIKDKYPVEKDPFEILKEFGAPGERRERLINLESSIKNLQKSLELIDESKDLLTEQAGYGLAIAVSIHEIAKITTNFYMGVSHLLKAGKLDKIKLQNLQDASVSLQAELNRLSPLRAIKNEKPSEFKISKAIKFASEIFKDRLSKLDIKLDISFKDDFSVYCRYGIIVQIFTNLFDNSYYWLDTIKGSGRKIEIKIDPKYRLIIFADNGPGIDEVILPYLFKPGYSLKIPPSGLGLYICKYYMQTIKGDINLVTERERIKSLKGAQFALDFNKVLSSKEETRK